MRLSQWNYSAATTLYPLGSCTMKYNPMVNEALARLPGFARLHPLAPTSLAQGALALLRALERALLRALRARRRHAAAGRRRAGRALGMMLIRAYHVDHGNARTPRPDPGEAHGTNPASSALCGYDGRPRCRRARAACSRRAPWPP